MGWKRCFATVVVGLLIWRSASIAAGQQAGPVDARSAFAPVPFSPPRAVVPEDVSPAAAPAESDAAASSQSASESDEGPEAKDKENGEEEESELSKRVAKVEEFMKKQNDQAAKDKAAAAKEPTFEIGGRIHLDQWAFPNTSQGVNYFENPSSGIDPEDRIAFRRIRLEIDGDIFETMFYRVQVDFNNPQTPEYKDVYIGFQELPFNQSLFVGTQKRPLGLDHINSSRFNVFTERPMVIDAFNEDSRRLGIAMQGFTDDKALNWRYGVFNLENTSATGRYVGDSLQLSGNARLSGSPWYDEASGGRGYFHWAIAGMLAHPDGRDDLDQSNSNEARFRSRPELRSTNRWLDTGEIAGADWYEVIGLETILNIGAFQFCGEYQTNWLQRDNSTVGTGPDLNFQGAYFYFSYFLTGEHVAYERTTGQLARTRPFENFFLVDRCTGGTGHGWGAWQIASRYSHLDLTDNDIRGGEGDNYTVALNWLWTSHSKLQFDATYGDIRDHQPVGGFTSGHFMGFGTRFAVDF